MEEERIERDFPECADLEEMRVRQSEFVNMNVVHLMERLESLQVGEAFLRDGDTAHLLASLPPEITEALLQSLADYEEEIKACAEAVQRAEAQRVVDLEKAEALAEKTARVRSSVDFLSEKNSADLMDFRRQLTSDAEAAKGRQRELADLVRKREKTDFDLRRVQMEIERLKRMSKRVKC